MAKYKNNGTGTWTDVEDGSGNATLGGDTVDVNTAGVYNVILSHTDTDGNTGTLTIPITIVDNPNTLYNLSATDRLKGKRQLIKLIRRGF